MTHQIEQYQTLGLYFKDGKVQTIAHMSQIEIGIPIINVYTNNRFEEINIDQRITDILERNPNTLVEAVLDFDFYEPWMKEKVQREQMKQFSEASKRLLRSKGIQSPEDYATFSIETINQLEEEVEHLIAYVKNLNIPLYETIPRGLAGWLHQELEFKLESEKIANPQNVTYASFHAIGVAHNAMANLTFEKGMKAFFKSLQDTTKELRRITQIRINNN